MMRDCFDTINTMVLKSFPFELGDNDRRFLSRVYSVSPSMYIDRLCALGLDSCERVLDAGCGFGQWSVCLASTGVEVLGVDLSALRVAVSNNIFMKLDLNARSLQARLDALPIAPESIDGVFCYGSLFCTAWKESLVEFARVLKPGGSLYFSANEIGYIINMWCKQPNLSEDFDPREAAAKTFVNTLEYEKCGSSPTSGQILIARDDAQFYLSQLGFEVIAVEAEGCINLQPDTISTASFFQAEYMGLPGCYEVLAKKRKATCHT